MKRTINLTSAGCLVLAATLLTGCASPGVFGGKPKSSESASGQVQVVAAPDDEQWVPPRSEKPTAAMTRAASLLDAQTVRELGLEEYDPRRTPAPVKESQHARAVRPVGIFGEQIGGKDVQTRPQGQGNLAQVSFLTDGASFDPAIDPAGRRIAFASTMHQSGSNLYLKSIGGSTVTQLTSDPADDVMPVFSPGGDHIAFASNRAGKWDIYVTSTSGGPPVQFTNDNDHEIHPTWAPDGRHIAYCKFNSQSGRWEIWVADVENPGVRRFLDYGMFPKWSPDVASSKILFQRPRQRGSRLHGVWTVDFINGQAMHPTEIVSAANAAAINPSWSPDGQRIVFVTIVDPEKAPADRPEQSDLWVVNLDGSGRVRLTDGQFANFQPVWAGDGSIYFISNRSGTDNIWAVATDRVIDLSGPGGIAGVPMERN